MDDKNWFHGFQALKPNEIGPSGVDTFGANRSYHLMFPDLPGASIVRPSLSGDDREDDHFSLRAKLVSHVHHAKKFKLLQWAKPLNKSRLKYDVDDPASLLKVFL